ncbi:L-serine ammonia-lyase, partial [Micrococcus sp. SIMBA_131]
RPALLGYGSHRAPPDQATKTMPATGADMKSMSKATSRGGLAVNVTEC